MKEGVASGARPLQSGLECGSEGKRRQVKGLTWTACCERAFESWDFPYPTGPLGLSYSKADGCG